MEPYGPINYDPKKICVRSCMFVKTVKFFSQGLRGTTDKRWRKGYLQALRFSDLITQDEWSELIKEYVKQQPAAQAAA